MKRIPKERKEEVIKFLQEENESIILATSSKVVFMGDTASLLGMYASITDKINTLKGVDKDLVKYAFEMGMAQGKKSNKDAEKLDKLMNVLTSLKELMEKEDI